MLAATRMLIEGTTPGRCRLIPQYSTHRALYGAIANAVQEFLARVRGSACWRSAIGRVSMLKDKMFTYRGHTFQVRATLFEKGWTVQVYEHEKPISAPYKITHDTAINYSTPGWGMSSKPLCMRPRMMWRRNIFQR